MGGFPPFLGFYPKWVVIRTVGVEAPATVGLVTVLRVVRLYYYINTSIGGRILEMRGKGGSAKSESSLILTVRRLGGGSL